MMIQADNISLCYRMNYDRASGIKEFIVQLLSGKVKYEEFWALRNVSFEIEKGEVMGVIGHNGAGKSTLLKVISGILKPTDGNVRVDGTVLEYADIRNKLYADGKPVSQVVVLKTNSDNKKLY